MDTQKSKSLRPAEIFYALAKVRLDPEILKEAEARRGLGQPQIFCVNPAGHDGRLGTRLEAVYSYLQQVARKDGRLGAQAPLIKMWTINYDFYSPRLKCFIEVDERQHFTTTRLPFIEDETTQASARYPEYFWTDVLSQLRAKPAARDMKPPHRDEQRAYRDLARELIPPVYGFSPTIRLDQYSLKSSGIDIKGLVHSATLRTMHST